MTLQNFTLGTFAQGAAGGGGSFESIASTVVTGNPTTLSFNSIPTTYQHLQIRILAERNTTLSHNFAIKVRLNSATGTNGAFHQLFGDGATVTASGTTSTQDLLCFDAWRTGATANTSTFGVGIVDIHDYASTTKNKTVRSFGGFDANGAGRVYLTSGLYISTTAVTSLQFYFDGDDLRNGSVFSLYGIKGA